MFEDDGFYFFPNIGFSCVVFYHAIRMPCLFLMTKFWAYLHIHHSPSYQCQARDHVQGELFDSLIIEDAA